MLANENEPLILADGTKIDPATGKVIREQATSPQYLEVPAAMDAIKQITAVRRSIVDLPAPPKQMNAIAVVCTYVLFGLCDQDIAIAMNITEDQVTRIKMLDAFDAMINKMSQAIVEQHSDDVRTMIAQHSKQAARRVVNLVNSDDDNVAFRAAQDVLDRAGHRPADVVEHRMRLDGGLTIEYVRRDERPIVEINPMEEFNGSGD